MLPQGTYLRKVRSLCFTGYTPALLRTNKLYHPMLLHVLRLITTNHTQGPTQRAASRKSELRNSHVPLTRPSSELSQMAKHLLIEIFGYGFVIANNSGLAC